MELTCTTHGCTNPRVTTERTKKSKCHDCLNRQHRDWEHRNKDAVAQHNRNFTEKHPGYKQKYYRKNKAAINAKTKAYREANPWVSVAANLNKRAKQWERSGRVSGAELKALAESQTTCQDCGNTEKLTIGHLIPLCYPISSGNISNLFRQCSDCNNEQHTRVHHSVATAELKALYPVFKKSF